MQCIELIKNIENWVPKEIAWEKDNPGLQVGSLERDAGNIFLCLELTEEPLREAIKKKCKFIFTHHPLIFQPLKKIDTQQNQTSRIIEQLIKNEITVYSAHTNLDFTKNGVSFELAKKLGLNNIRFLKNIEDSKYKLVLFVPATHIAEISEAIFTAGGGIIGNYQKCSFRLAGTGTFLGSEETNPSIGSAMEFEKVDEIRFEVIVDKWNLAKVISAMLSVHPYEEPAYDIYPLKNKNLNFGYGAIGEFTTPLFEKEFYSFISHSLNLKNFRYTKGKKDKIKTVAVCGGSGSELLSAAISANADAYITSDIKYHTFHDAYKNIILVDAGHYETEIHSLNEVKIRIEKILKQSRSKDKVFLYSGTTNPVEFYKN